MAEPDHEPQDSPIAASIHSTKEHFFRSHALHRRSQMRPAYRAAQVFVGGLICAAALSGLLNYDRVLKWGMFTLGALNLSVPVVQAIAIRRAWAKRPFRDVRADFQFSWEGLQSSMPELSQSKASWKLVDKCLVAPDGVILYPKAATATWIWLPRTAFSAPEDLERLIELARAKGVPCRVLP